MNKLVSIIGIGMDGAETLTEEARQKITQADVLIGASRMLAPFCSMGKEMFNAYQSEEIAAYINHCKYDSIAVLMSGDAGFYSGAKNLLPLLSAYDVSVVSGISSPVYAANRLKMTWQDMYFVSLHGTEKNVVRIVASHKKTFILLGGDVTAAHVCRRLCAYGLSDVEVFVLSQLAAPEEKIYQGAASEFEDLDVDSLSVMVVVNRHYEKQISTGIPDEAFIRGAVPMSKAEVRAVVMSKLSPGKQDCCWDIGCGTGAVSVELARLAWEGRVVAVDKHEDAIILTEQNSRRFCCDNIEIRKGSVSGLLCGLPKPDVVFIGGASKSISHVIHAAYEKNPGVRLCMTAVSLETLLEAQNAFCDIGRDIELTQISVSHTKQVGSHHMFTAQNPVFIITGKHCSLSGLEK